MQFCLQVNIYSEMGLLIFPSSSLLSMLSSALTSSLTSSLTCCTCGHLVQRWVPGCQCELTGGSAMSTWASGHLHHRTFSVPVCPSTITWWVCSTWINTVASLSVGDCVTQCGREVASFSCNWDNDNIYLSYNYLTIAMDGSSSHMCLVLAWPAGPPCVVYPTLFPCSSSSCHCSSGLLWEVLYRWDWVAMATCTLCASLPFPPAVVPTECTCIIIMSIVFSVSSVPHPLLLHLCDERRPTCISMRDRATSTAVCVCVCVCVWRSD